MHCAQAWCHVITKLDILDLDLAGIYNLYLTYNSYCLNYGSPVNVLIVVLCRHVYRYANLRTLSFKG